MSLDFEQVRKISKLSRIKMTDDQINKMRFELDKIFNHIDVIKNADTEKVEPTGHSVDLDSVFRNDVVENSTSVKDVLRNAPDTEDDFFSVRKII